MTMEQVAFSLRGTIYGMLKSLVVRATQNNIDLLYDVDSRIPDQLVGDALRLRQVITNLVGNALKFTPAKVDQRGTVAIIVRLQKIEDGNATIEFCVSDTGIGIPHDKLEYIFDTFAQADGSTTRVSKDYSPRIFGALLTAHLGVRWNGSWFIDLETPGVFDARCHLGPQPCERG